MTDVSAGERFRAAFNAAYEVENVGDELLLDMAVRILDELTVLERILADEGVMLVSPRGVRRTHPALSEVRKHRVLLEVVLRRLKSEPSLPGSASASARRAAQIRWHRQREGGVVRRQEPVRQVVAPSPLDETHKRSLEKIREQARQRAMGGDDEV